MTLRAILVALFSILVLASTAAADETAPANLGNACAGCHGTDGKSPGPTPAIDELAAADISTMMRAFKTDEVIVTMMNRIAKGYTDEEIDAIANYFGGM